MKTSNIDVNINLIIILLIIILMTSKHNYAISCVFINTQVSCFLLEFSFFLDATLLTELS